MNLQLFADTTSTDNTTTVLTSTTNPMEGLLLQLILWKDGLRETFIVLLRMKITSF